MSLQRDLYHRVLSETPKMCIRNYSGEGILGRAVGDTVVSNIWRQICHGMYDCRSQASLPNSCAAITSNERPIVRLDTRGEPVGIISAGGKALHQASGARYSPLNTVVSRETKTARSHTYR